MRVIERTSSALIDKKGLLGLRNGKSDEKNEPDAQVDNYPFSRIEMARI